MTASFLFAHVFTVELSLILLQFKINLNLSNDKSTPSSRWRIFKYCAIQYMYTYTSPHLFFCLSMIVLRKFFSLFLLVLLLFLLFFVLTYPLLIFSFSWLYHLFYPILYRAFFFLFNPFLYLLFFSFFISFFAYFFHILVIKLCLLFEIFFFRASSKSTQSSFPSTSSFLGPPPHVSFTSLSPSFASRARICKRIRSPIFHQLI